jgi:hypothetical protein
LPPLVSQASYRDNLLRANRAVIDRIRTTVAAVPTEAMLRSPPDGGWSIGEVLEHLIISADSYLEVLRRTVEREKGSTASPDAMWRPSFMGGLLVGSFRSPRRMRAPRIYRPGPTPRPRVLEELIRRQEEVARLIAEGALLDWRRINLRSPVIPLIRMNLGDAFAVPVVHAERHAGQIERVKTTITEERQ